MPDRRCSSAATKPRLLVRGADHESIRPRKRRRAGRAPAADSAKQQQARHRASGRAMPSIRATTLRSPIGAWMATATHEGPIEQQEPADCRACAPESRRRSARRARHRGWWRDGQLTANASTKAVARCARNRIARHGLAPQRALDHRALEAGDRIGRRDRLRAERRCSSCGCGRPGSRRCRIPRRAAPSWPRSRTSLTSVQARLSAAGPR